VHGVKGERGFAMIVCGIAILLSFTIWVAKIFTLHRQLHPGNWLLIVSFDLNNLKKLAGINGLRLHYQAGHSEIIGRHIFLCSRLFLSKQNKAFYYKICLRVSPYNKYRWSKT
jgi:hypothetical protein